MVSFLISFQSIKLDEGFIQTSKVCNQQYKLDRTKSPAWIRKPEVVMDVNDT